MPTAGTPEMLPYLRVLRTPTAGRRWGFTLKALVLTKRKRLPQRLGGRVR